MRRLCRLGCFYRCVSVHRGSGAIPACIAGGIPACLAAGLQGGGILACLAGFQADTQGGSLGGSGWGGSPGPHPRGKLRGVPAPGGGVSALGGRGLLVGGCGDPPMMATAAAGTHPPRMHSCSSYFSCNLLIICIVSNTRISFVHKILKSETCIMYTLNKSMIKQIF